MIFDQQTIIESPSDRFIIIDGNNVAYTGFDNLNPAKSHPQIKLIEIAQKIWLERGFNVIVLISPSLKYKIDDRKKLEECLSDPSFQETPAGFDDDLFILEAAKTFGALIFSNDRFKEYQINYPDFKNRRVPFLFINGSLIIPRCIWENLIEDGRKNEGN